MTDTPWKNALDALTTKIEALAGSGNITAEELSYLAIALDRIGEQSAVATAISEIAQARDDALSDISTNAPSLTAESFYLAGL